MKLWDLFWRNFSRSCGTSLGRLVFWIVIYYYWKDAILEFARTLIHGK